MGWANFPAKRPALAKLKEMSALNDHLICPICLDSFKDPRILPCHHYFCKECIEEVMRSINSKDQGSTLLVCPECRGECPIDSAENLAPAFFINRLECFLKQGTQSNECGLCSRGGKKAVSVCHTCDSYLCGLCHDAHKYMRPFQGHKLLSLYDKECHLHQEPMKYYCQQCCEVICSDCIVQTHNGHRVSLVQLLAEEYKTELQSKMNELGGFKDALASLQANLTETEASVKKNQLHLAKVVESSFSHLHEVIDQIKEEMRSKASDVFACKYGDLTHQNQALNTTASSIALSTTAISDSINNLPMTELVLNYNSLLRQCEEKIALCKAALDDVPDELNSHAASVKIELTSSENLKYFLSLGCNIYDTSADPTKCSLVDMPQGNVEVETELNLRLVVRNSANKPCKSPQHVDIYYRPLAFNGAESTKVKCVFVQGIYEIIFTPTKRGRFELCIDVNCEPISGSPVVFHACMPVDAAFREPLNIIQVSQCPWGIACDPSKGFLAVSEAMTTGSIVLLKPEINLPFTKIQSQISHTEIICPCGIAIDGDGSMFVTDAGSHFVYKVDCSGQLLHNVGGHGLVDPVGVTCLNNKVFVCDSERNCVMVFDSRNLCYLWKFGKTGSDKGNLLNPTDITVSNSKVLYISDNGNSRVQSFSQDGLFLSSFGEKVLSKPAAIHYDQHRNVILVSDLKLLCVFVFSCNGEYFSKFGEDFITSSPSGITCDRDGFIYVCDHYGKCVYVF